MSETCVIVLGNMDDAVGLDEEADYIGADRGAFLLAQKGIHFSYAIGDFDSVTEVEMDRIQEFAAHVIRLNPIKADTDAKLAVDLALAQDYKEIHILGGLGGRLDHELVNERLCYLNPGIVTLHDGQNTIFASKENVLFHQEKGYISFFTFETACISLRGFAYPLIHQSLTALDLYTVSNELCEEEAELIVHSGCVLVMESKDRKKSAHSV